MSKNPQAIEDQKSSTSTAAAGTHTATGTTSTNAAEGDQNEVIEQRSNNGDDKDNEFPLPASGNDQEEKNETTLSKSQLKKRRRKERLREQNALKKQRKKQVKEAKALAEGRDLDEVRRIQEMKAQNENSASKNKSKRIWEAKTKKANDRFRICLDCSFEDLMTAKEVNSLATQIRHCYAANKRSENPVLFSVASLSGTTKDILTRVNGFPESWYIRAFSCSEKPVSEFHEDTSKLVYLTSDSTNELEHLEDDKVYIIGGIVDRNRLKRATIDKAKSLGIATAKLPIGKHLKLFATKVLTCNHVFEILLKYRANGNDWKKAMIDVLPARKDVEELPEKNHQGTDVKDENTDCSGAT